jgi:hypothetical protein
MKITVNHADFDRQTGKVLGYTTVAEVNVPVEISAFGTTDECLEYAWRYTNNVDGSWSMKIGSDANDNVTVLAELHTTKDGRQMGLRSSMMGDRFVVDGVEYKVAMAGFTQVETETV